MDTQDPNIKDVLAQFLGQTYSELHKIDKNITGTSNNLSYKSDEFKRVATQVLNSVEQGHAAPVGTQRVVSPPLIQHQPVPVIVETNQLEFNFDNSPNAKNIFAALQRIESKIESIEKNISKILDLRKK